MFLSGICEENVRKSLEIGNVEVVGWVAWNLLLNSCGESCG